MAGADPKVMSLNKFDGKSGAVAFFNIYLPEYGLVATENVLKVKDGKFRWSPPGKYRMKAGEHVINDAGFKQWDDYVRAYTEKAEGEDKGKPVEAYWTYYNAVLDQAVAMYEGTTSANKGRGAPKATSTGRVRSGAGSTQDGGKAPSDGLPF